MRKKKEYSRNSKNIVIARAWYYWENMVPTEIGKMGKAQIT